MENNLTKAREELFKRVPRSRKLAASANELLPAEVSGGVEMPCPIYLESCSGSRVTDVDGNTYLDLTMGFGPHLLGHTPEVVKQALRRQLDRSWQVAIHNPEQVELARLLVEASPCADSVVFCNSGTEATMYAVRVARAFTNKPKVAMFEGGYHGAHDYCLYVPDTKSDRSQPGKMTRGRGIPAVAQDTVIMLPYRDDHALELIERHRDELALVMIAPVQAGTPSLNNKAFLHALLETCRRNKVLFLLDEVVTGFRIAYGGCQEYYDIIPDLVTYGKALGGGMPIGALAGRKDVMDLFRGAWGSGWTLEKTTDDKKAIGDNEYVFSTGTYSGNPFTMAAGCAAVEYMHDHKDEIYPYLKKQGDRFAKELNDFCRDREIPAQVMNAASIFMLIFQRGKIDNARDMDPDKKFVTAERAFYLHLLNHGVIMPGVHLGLFSTAHTPADVDTIIEAFKQSLIEVERDHLFA